MSSELRKPEAISWNAASVELPEIPTLPAGQDAMSATISAVLPTLAAQLTVNVAALSAKENTFSGKLGVAQTAYQNSDDAGSQSVGQVVGMLGQLGQQAGQMGQSAGAPVQALGGQTGMLGSQMQQAMHGTQGGGGESGGQSGGGQGAGGAVLGGATPSPAVAAGQQARIDAELRAEPAVEQTREERGERDEHQPLHRADGGAPSGAAGPEDRSSSRPAPVTPPDQARRGEGDVTRNL
jgi:hypothetical protein